MVLFARSGPRPDRNFGVMAEAGGCGRAGLVVVAALTLAACTNGGPGGPVVSVQPAAAESADAAGAETARPDRFAEQITVARRQLAQNQTEQARATFAAVLAADPGNIAALNGLGVALDTLGRHDEAQALYRRALEQDPDNVVARNNLGLSLTLSGRYSDAIAVLEPIALGDTALPRARQNLAIAMALSGDREGAARVSRVDLREEDVQSNLKLLASMRQ